MVKGNFGYATNKVIIKDVAQNVRDNDNPRTVLPIMSTCLFVQVYSAHRQRSMLFPQAILYMVNLKLGGLNFEDVSGIADGVPDGKIDDYDRQILKGKHSLILLYFWIKSERYLEWYRS